MKYAFRQAQIPRPLFCSRGARHDKSRSYSNSHCSHFVVAANDLGLIRRNTDFSFCGFWPLGRPGILSIVPRVSSRQICQLRNSRPGRIIFIGNEKNCSGMDELVHQCLLSGSMSMSAELVVWGACCPRLRDLYSSLIQLYFAWILIGSCVMGWLYSFSFHSLHNFPYQPPTAILIKHPSTILAG